MSGRIADEELLAKINAVRAEFPGCGYTRISKILKTDDKRIYQAMTAAGLSPHRYRHGCIICHLPLDGLPPLWNVCSLKCRAECERRKERRKYLRRRDGAYAQRYAQRKRERMRLQRGPRLCGVCGVDISARPAKARFCTQHNSNWRAAQKRLANYSRKCLGCDYHFTTPTQARYCQSCKAARAKPEPERKCRVCGAPAAPRFRLFCSDAHYRQAQVADNRHRRQGQAWRENARKTRARLTVRRRSSYNALRKIFPPLDDEPVKRNKHQRQRSHCVHCGKPICGLRRWEYFLHVLFELGGVATIAHIAKATGYPKTIIWADLCRRIEDSGKRAGADPDKIGMNHWDASRGPLKLGALQKPWLLRDLAGQRFGQLTVTGFAGMDVNRQAWWFVRCDCGNEIAVRGARLLYGEYMGRKKSGIRDCGCSKNIIWRPRREYANWQSFSAERGTTGRPFSTDFCSEGCRQAKVAEDERAQTIRERAAEKIVRQLVSDQY